MSELEQQWSDGNPNDGEFEYTRATDCQGNILAYWKRRPALKAEPTPWQPATAGEFEAAHFVDGGAS